MLTKYIKGEFTDQYNVTVGVEFTSKTVRIDEKTQVKLQIWDTVPPCSLRPVRKPSVLSCDPSTREFVASSSPLVSIMKKALPVSMDGFVRPGKMLINKQYFS